MRSHRGHGEPAAPDRAEIGRQCLILLAVLTEKQYQALFRALERPDVLAEPRFADWFLRMENAAAMKAEIERALQADSIPNWEARLRAADIPCARVWGIDEITTHPQLAHRAILQTVGSEFGTLKLAGPAFRMEEGEGGITRPPPRVGQHSDEILREAGYSADEIAALRASGAV